MYKVVTIETEYSIEKFLFNYDSEATNWLGSNASAEEQAENFLSDYCFCDDFEIIDIRNATEKESNLMEEYLKEEMDFWEAQKLVCYPERNSINEIIMKIAKYEGEK